MNKELEEALQGADPKELALMLRIEMFRNGNFDFIVKGKANNSEGDWKEGDIAEHKKQKRALEILTDNEHEEFLYGGAAGGAKAQPLDAKIYTPFGYKLMGNIKVGDVIKSPSGGNTNVIGVHPQGLKKIYEVEFIDGAKTRCCGEHLWSVWYSGNLSKQEKNNGKGKIQTTEMLIKNLNKKPIIPLSKPLEFTLPVNRFTIPIWHKIDPYVLGCLIGDGGLTKQIGFTTCDNEIIKLIEDRLPQNLTVNKLKDKYSYSITQNERDKNGYPINEMYSFIREIGLDCKSEFKFIPEKLKHSPLSVRFDLCRGLMDTDGTVDKRGHCSYSSSSEQLALDFQYILRSLGYKVTLKRKKTTHLDSYRLYIQGNDCSLLFNLKRKKDRCKNFNGGISEAGRRIVSIKEVGVEQTQCITVDSLDRLYVTDDFIVTHNTWTGVSWITFSALAYPNTNWFIARNQLKDLLDSVFRTFKAVCMAYGIEDYKFNGQKNFIEFPNGSVINLIEVSYKPSDPMYEDLGSTEYTGGWIEEIGEVHEMAAIVLGTRIGRSLNKKYGLKKKLFLTCNPKQNWGKTKFYEKHMNGTLYKENKELLETGKKRIQRIYLNCLVTENPFIDQDYIDGLMAKALEHKPTYERLFKGNWDYEDNPYQLCEQEMIEKIYDNNHVEQGRTYITADIARLGNDMTVIGVWRGWRLIEVITIDKSKLTVAQDYIFELRRKYQIPKNRCIADEDGIGGGVIDNCGILGFKNGGTPMKEKGVYGEKKEQTTYRNLQIQCLYHLADKVNEGGLWIMADINSKQQQDIKQELAQIIREPSDYGKIDLKRKSEIKKDIGRSPDYRDMLLMRVYFDLKGVKRQFVGSKKRNYI